MSEFTTTFHFTKARSIEVSLSQINIVYFFAIWNYDKALGVSLVDRWSLEISGIVKLWFYFRLKEIEAILWIFYLSPRHQRLSRFSGYIWFLWVEKTLSNLSDRLMIIDNHRPSRNPRGTFRSTYLEFVLNWWNHFLSEDALKHTLIFYSLLRNFTHQKLSCPPISAVMLVLWTWRHRAWKFIRCYSYSF